MTLRSLPFRDLELSTWRLVMMSCLVIKKVEKIKMLGLAPFENERERPWDEVSQPRDIYYACSALFGTLFFKSSSRNYERQ